MSTACARSGQRYSTTPTVLLTDPNLSHGFKALYGVLDAGLRGSAVTTSITAAEIGAALGLTRGRITDLFLEGEAAGWIRRRRQGRGWETFVAHYPGEPAPWEVEAGAIDAGYGAQETARHNDSGRAENDPPDAPKTTRQTSSYLSIEKEEPKREATTVDYSDPFVTAMNRWPRDVRDRVDARRLWQHEKGICGSALEFEHRVTAWLDYWDRATDDERRCVFGMTKWLRNHCWREEPGSTPTPPPGQRTQAEANKAWMEHNGERPAHGFETEHPEGSPEFIAADEAYAAWLNGGRSDG